MSYAESAKLMQLRKAAVTELRSVLKRAREGGTENLGETRAQFDKIMENVSELRQKADLEYMNHQVESLEKEFRGEQESLPTPEVRGSRQTPEGQKELRMQAFNRYLKVGRTALTPEETRALQPPPELRNVIASQDSKGGYLVVEQFGSEVLKKLDNIVHIRRLAMKEQVVNAGSLGYPTIETDPDDLSWSSEIKTVTDDTSLEFGKREFIPHGMKKRIKCSEFMLLNSSYSVDSVIRDRLSFKIAATQENAYINGTGAGEPLGLMVASSQGINTDRDMSTGNTETAITYEGLVRNKFNIKPQYRPGAAWMFHTDAVRNLSLILDGESRPIWREGLAPGEPDLLLGMPLYESQYMPSTFTTGLYVGLLGNFEFYRIADVSMVPIRRIDDVHYATSEVAFVAQYWGDAMPVFSEAFSRVTLA